MSNLSNLVILLDKEYCVFYLLGIMTQILKSRVFCGVFFSFVNLSLDLNILFHEFKGESVWE